MKGIIFLIAACISYAFATQICQELTKNQKTLTQSLPTEFHVGIEVVDIVKQKISNIHMFYSKTRGIIRLDVTKAKNTHKQFFYFNDNEILTFAPIPGRGSCTVQTDLANSVDDFLFGGSHLKSVFPAPLAVLHFSGLSGFGSDQIVQNSIGPGKTRDKATTVYTSCQHWTSAKNNIYVNLTHAFAASGVSFPSKFPQLLQMKISGTGTVGGIAGTKVNIVSNFYNFHTHFPDTKTFETPDGIVCPGRKLDKKLPTNLPNFIRYTYEIIDPYKNHYSQGESIYDFLSQYFIHRYQPFSGTDTDYNRMIEVFDFNGQTLYSVDQKQKICSYNKNATAYFKNHPFVNMDGNKAVMASAKQYFFSNAGAASYLGQRKLRGMLSETWVGEEKVFLGVPNGVIQWNFAPPVSSWNDDNPLYLKNHYPIPLKFQYWKAPTDKDPVVQNIFHTDYNAPRPDFLDLSSCFSKNVHFQIVAKGSRKLVVNSELEAFKYKLANEISKAVKIQPIQINKMKVYYSNDNDDVIIEFYIGTNDGNIDKLSGMLTDQVTNFKIKLYIYDKTSKKWTKTLKLTSIDYVKLDAVTKNAALKQNDQQNNKGKYKPGDMAGIGVGMTLVGVLGGVGAAIAHSRYYSIYA